MRELAHTRRQSSYVNIPEVLRGVLYLEAHNNGLQKEKKKKPPAPSVRPGAHTAPQHTHCLLSDPPTRVRSYPLSSLPVGRVMLEADPQIPELFSF